jgi:hypothetical protein
MPFYPKILVHIEINQVTELLTKLSTWYYCLLSWMSSEVQQNKVIILYQVNN